MLVETPTDLDYVKTEKTSATALSVYGGTDIQSEILLDDQEAASALCWAAGNGHLGVMRLLISVARADINAVHKGVTPLNCAAIRGSYVVARHILSLPGTNANGNPQGMSALWYAAAHNSSDVAELLLRRDDVEVNTQDAGEQQTPLAIAAARNHIQIVRLLLADSRTDVSVPDVDGRTPLHRATEAGHGEVALLLLSDDRIDPTCRDHRGRTPLHYAAAVGLEEVARCLLRNFDVDVNATDKWMSTALHNAAGGGHLSIVNLLLCADAAQVDLRDEFNRTPLWLASYYGRREVVQRLLLEDVDVNVAGPSGSTPLHHATKDGDLALTELLLERPGLDPNRTDPRGRTALWLAAEVGDVQMIIAFLRDCRVEMVNDDRGQGPVHIARIRGHTYAVRLLEARMPRAGATFLPAMASRSS
ncbi:hypothetical protein Asppvi_010838 [Aspergillus pseudoviridinutans]|uniref:Ankyrin repeat-containing domain protein n=1 Tax=Aspergillus pseudoviridinutans TaxID=1517512 RepID=A0A9P3BP09_9EURO|nr:uncharacterized protein Asppvi_010838 [Aspergillus pseudoviridinutans]GIJ91863.1 hypothetical protein Asppvi_010838 [Aspergillus pseudoviridinutans]